MTHLFSARGLISAAIVGACLIATACESTPDSKPDQPPTSKPSSNKADNPEDKPTEAPSLSPEAQMTRLTDDQRAFTADLLKKLSQTEGNLIYSPYSIHVALGMTREGARGETARQMSEVAHLSLGADQPAAMAAQQAALLDVRKSEYIKVPLELSVANRVWVQKRYPLEAAFVAALDKGYGAAPESVDFEADTEAARGRINTWVGDRTRKKIPELIKPGILNGDTRLVLTNAIYFKGAWQHIFKEQNTRDADFHAADGKRKVKMMHQSARFQYKLGADRDIISLPYQGHDADMLIILPKAGKLDSVTASLDAAGLAAAMTQQLDGGRVNLQLPRFTFRTPVRLDDTLKAMGMTAPFDEEVADFTAMSPLAEKEQLHIDAVIHEAFIEVNEKGTEAAAATAVIMGRAGSAMPVKPVDFIVDRPFLFIIRHTKTNTPLFIGRVAAP